jgi:hypothetical protein
VGLWKQEQANPGYVLWLEGVFEMVIDSTLLVFCTIDIQLWGHKFAARP